MTSHPFSVPVFHEINIFLILILMYVCIYIYIYAHILHSDGSEVQHLPRMQEVLGSNLHTARQWVQAPLVECEPLKGESCPSEGPLTLVRRARPHGLLQHRFAGE